MKKHVCILFCIVLIMSTPVHSYAAATAGTLTVAAGSGAAVGGLFSGFGLSSATSAVALTMVLLGSLGATVKLTDEAIQAGKKVQDVIMDKFAQWVGGSSAESMTEEQKEELKKRFQVINGGGGTSGSDDQGTNIGPDGKVYFGLGALGILTEFIKFLQSKDDIKEVPASEPVSYVDLGFCKTVLSNTLRRSSNNGVMYSVVEFSQPCAVFKVIADSTNNEYGWAALCQNSFSVYHYDFYPPSDGPFNKGRWNANVSDGYAMSSRGYPFVTTDFIPDEAYTLTWSEVNAVKNNITKWEETTSSGGVNEDGIYADNLNTDLIDNNDGKPIVVDPELLPNVSPDTDQQVSIPDYLQYILDNANANASTSQDPLEVPVTDPVTLSPGTLTVPVQEQDPINQPLPAEYTTPEDTPVNPVQDPTQVPKPTETIKLLKVDLTEIFPFCIPWDIYNLLSKFAADPVTPSVDWDWGSILGFLGINTVSHLDLHDYDGVAEILRNMETVVFCIGLAYATKKVFIK